MAAAGRVGFLLPVMSAASRVAISANWMMPNPACAECQTVTERIKQLFQRKFV
jgi:hypothetical protein